MAHTLTQGHIELCQWPWGAWRICTSVNHACHSCLMCSSINSISTKMIMPLSQWQNSLKMWCTIGFVLICSHQIWHVALTTKTRKKWGKLISLIRQHALLLNHPSCGVLFVSCWTFLSKMLTNFQSPAAPSTMVDHNFLWMCLGRPTQTTVSFKSSSFWTAIEQIADISLWFAAFIPIQMTVSSKSPRTSGLQPRPIIHSHFLLLYEVHCSFRGHWLVHFKSHAWLSSKASGCTNIS